MKKSFLLSACLLVGCEQRPPTEQSPVMVAPQSIESPRFRVTALAEFHDDLAYGGRRRIYEITDTKTKRVYLGVTGLGLDRKQSDDDAADTADVFNTALDSMQD